MPLVAIVDVWHSLADTPLDEQFLVATLECQSDGMVLVAITPANRYSRFVQDAFARRKYLWLCSHLSDCT